MYSMHHVDEGWEQEKSCELTFFENEAIKCAQRGSDKHICNTRQPRH